MIAGIHRKRRLAVTDDDRVGAIVTLFDAVGEETDGIDAAVSGVVRLSDTEWVAIALDDYPETPTH